MSSSAFIRKNFRLTLLASIVTLGALTTANSFAASVETTATSTVIAPITITNPVNLDFGRFIAGTAVGTVIVDTDGGRTATGDVVLPTVGPTPTAAQFLVTGGSDATYTISWTGGTTLTNTGVGVETMAMAMTSNLTGAAGATTNVMTGTLSPEGTQTIHMGGTLSVGADQVAGTYEGAVTATVEYN